MEKHKRSIFYLYDSQKGLIHAYDDGGSVDDAFAELEEYIAECSGSYVIVELPKEAKGKGARGGNKLTTEEAKFTYKVKLNNGNARNDGGAIGSMGIIMQLMKENRDIMVEMREERSQRQLDKLQKELDDLKEDKDNGLEGFAKLVMKEYKEAQRVKGIANDVGATAKQPVAGEGKPVSPEKRKVLDALKQFAEVDPDYVNNLAFMAQYAKSHPEIYAGFVEKLKNPEA